MTMPSEPAVASFDFRSGPLRGTQLTLYGARLLHHGVGYMESMPLAAIAAVRVSYERHEQRIGWGVALGVAALLLFLVFRPIAAFAVGASAEVADGQAVGQLLRTALSALEAFARLLPVAGVLCLAAGAALVVLGWIGTTTLVLMLPAAERVFPVRGQSPLLVEFAELLAERVAQRNGR
jgi:signal transduction histidine kinase